MKLHLHFILISENDLGSNKMDLAMYKPATYIHPVQVFLITIFTQQWQE